MINNLNPNFGTSQIAPFDGDPILKKKQKNHGISLLRNMNFWRGLKGKRKARCI